MGIIFDFNDAPRVLPDSNFPATVSVGYFNDGVWTHDREGNSILWTKNKKPIRNPPYFIHYGNKYRRWTISTPNNNLWTPQTHKQNSIKIVNNPPSLYNKIVLNRHSPMIFQGHKYYLCPIILGNGILGRFPPKSSERLSSVKIFCLPRKIFIHRDKICA